VNSWPLLVSPPTTAQKFSEHLDTLLFYGQGITVNQVEIVTILLQIPLAGVNIFLVYEIALLLFKRVEIAQFYSLLYAIEPSILYSVKLLSDHNFPQFS